MTTQTETPAELPTETVESFYEESNTTTTLSLVKEPTGLEIHTFVVTGTNLNTVVGEVLYAGLLGAELVPKYMPRLSGLPYQVKLQMSKDAYGVYLSGEGRKLYDETLEYNKVTVTQTRADRYITELLKLGAAGGVIAPRVAMRSTGGMLQAQIQVRNPIETSPTVSLYPKIVKYSKEELTSYDIHQLKIIGGHYGIKGRSKQALIKDILDKQESIK